MPTVIRQCYCLHLLIWIIVFLAANGPALAVERVEADGIRGTLAIVGGGTVPTAVKEIIATTVGREPLVVIAAAAASPETAGRQAAQWLREAGVDDVRVPPYSGDREQDTSALAAVLQVARGVWICGGQQARLAQAFSREQIELELKSLISRGGIVGGTSAGAAILSGVMIASGQQSPKIDQGWDLLPNSIIDQHFTQRDRQSRLRLAIAAHRHCVGVGIDEGTAAIISGRTIRVAGEGSVSMFMAQSKFRPTSELQLHSGEVADWVQLIRSSRARHQHEDASQPSAPVGLVGPGALVIVGGGRMPQDVVDRFIELASGRNARIAVLPTAGSREAAFRATLPSFLVGADVADVRMLPHSRIDEVNSDEFQSVLRQATGVWFGGGRQWNFIDAYEGTSAIELFRDVLRRGGVIGGSSAGATIQGDYLVRGHPLGNSIMMAEGYERGFAFLPGVAIDQHFSQRKREADLTTVISRFPQYLGIGIDEGTALVVKGKQAQVIGSHGVHFLSSNGTAGPGDYITARPGDQVTLQPFLIQRPQGDRK